MSELDYSDNSGSYTPTKSIRETYDTLRVAFQQDQKLVDYAYQQGLAQKALRDLNQQICDGLKIKYSEKLYNRLENEIKSKSQANCFSAKLVSNCGFIHGCMFVRMDGIAWLGDPTIKRSDTI